MEATTKAITIETLVKSPISKVWSYWSEPKHITRWCQASPEWHAPKAENDLRTGGQFVTVMAAKDGSMSFPFGGTYTNVRLHDVIEYTLADDRKVKITFQEKDNETKIIETFDPESENTEELQRNGWQSILDSFKNYTESN